VQWLLYGSESRSIMYTFIYSNLHSHGYEDVTIHHQRTSKNHTTLLNFPYIHSHTQSHFPRAPPWPSPPAFSGLVLAVNQYVVASRAQLFSRWSYPPTVRATDYVVSHGSSLHPSLNSAIKLMRSANANAYFYIFQLTLLK